jgi:uncharacterized delta-60 repeat protein
METMKRRSVAALALASAGFVLLAGLLVVPALAVARPGDLDPTFSDDGRVLTEFNYFSNPSVAFAYAVAVQEDGRIVAAGTAEQSNQAVALARYLPNGSLDPSFGEGGRATLDTGDTGAHEWAYAVAIQSDGGIVVAGRISEGPMPGSEILVARLTSGGDLDHSFGDDGLRIVDIGKFASARGIALTSGDSIVIAGYRVGSQDENEVAILKLTSDGDLNQSFANGGLKLIRFGSGAAAESVAIDDTGKITAGGVGARGKRVGQAFVRVHRSGALDRSFSDDGRRLVLRSGESDGIALTPSGGIVSAGTVIRYQPHTFSDLVFVGLRPDGSLKGSFGNDGLRRIDLNRIDSSEGVVLQSDGKIVAGVTTNPEGNQFAILRLTRKGRFDRSFSGNGRTVTYFYPYGTGVGHMQGMPSAVAMQPNGGIILAGTELDYGTSYINRFALARYKNDGTPADG